jgi:geranyl-CoA carboxylase alpha subunit
MLALARDGRAWQVEHGGDETRLEIVERGDTWVRFAIEGHLREARYVLVDDAVHLDIGGRVHAFEDATLAPPSAEAGAAADGILRAPMSGLVVVLDVAEGDQVRRGQVVAILEAMKMEHQIIAPADGVVAAVAVAKGAQVGARDILVKVNSEQPQ